VLQLPRARLPTVRVLQVVRRICLWYLEVSAMPIAHTHVFRQVPPVDVLGHEGEVFQKSHLRTWRSGRPPSRQISTPSGKRARPTALVAAAVEAAVRAAVKVASVAKVAAAPPTNRGAGAQAPPPCPAARPRTSPSAISPRVRTRLMDIHKRRQCCHGCGTSHGVR
jgi:hypothetical protein